MTADEPTLTEAERLRRDYERAVLDRLIRTMPGTDETPDFVAAITGAMIDARPLLAERLAQVTAEKVVAERLAGVAEAVCSCIPAYREYHGAHHADCPSLTVLAALHPKETR